MKRETPGSDNWSSNHSRDRGFSRGRGRSNSRERGRFVGDIFIEGNKSNNSTDQSGQLSYQRSTRDN